MQLLVIKRVTLLVVTVVLLINAALTSAQGANLTINKDIRYQKIIGFGGGLVFNMFPYNHPLKDQLYDSLFNNARINVLRMGNWYNPQENNFVKEIPMVREIKQKWPHVKTMLSSWSPPPYLKSNNTIYGVSFDPEKPEEFIPATIKKNSDSTYMYKEYGEYWYQTIKHFRDSGVTFDWISIQNEPDIHTDYEGCRFDPVENDTIASYGKALSAAYTACENKFTPPVQFIGPDVAGVEDGRMLSYITSADFDKSHITAYAHHYYDFASKAWLQRTANEFNDKPILQTEFLINENIPNWQNITRSWIDHAQVIMQLLKIEQVKAYCIFALTYKPASTHCFFSLDTLGGEGFTVRPTWYMFKHFSRSIHPGWQLTFGNTDDQEIMSGMFFSPNNDSAALVLINSSLLPKTVHYTVPTMKGTLYQTSDSLKYASMGQLPSRGSIQLPARSISTVDFVTDSTAVHVLKPGEKTKYDIHQITRAHDNSFLIDYSMQDRFITVTIFDIRGRICYKQHLQQKGTERILWQATPGVYTMQITGKQSKIVHSFTRN